MSTHRITQHPVLDIPSSECVTIYWQRQPLSARRGFFGCGHFSKANDWLAAEGAGRIDWRLP